MFTALSVFLRSLARRTGLTHPVHRVLGYVYARREDDYEKEVEQFVHVAVRHADVVWDIGANRGLYTKILSALVGKEGLVVAIEPEANNMAHLASAVWPLANVTLLNAALTDHDGEISLYVNSADPTGRTHSLTTASGAVAKAQTVPCFSGDSLITRRLAPQPTFMKIDVEGAEERVLAGLAQTLESPALRSILVEVHFAVLEQQGDAYAPVRIERLLRSKNFSVKWLNRSHIAATKQDRGSGISSRSVCI
jgi:FkbM family methyltransferase